MKYEVRHGIRRRRCLVVRRRENRAEGRLHPNSMLRAVAVFFDFLDPPRDGLFFGDFLTRTLLGLLDGCLSSKSIHGPFHRRSRCWLAYCS